TLGRTALLFLAPALLLTLFLTTQAPSQTFTRGLIFFAVIWPVLSTAVLFGAHAPRHLYLSSIGVAIAFGLAGSQLLTSRPPVVAAGLAITGLLLALFAVGLTASTDFTPAMDTCPARWPKKSTPPLTARWQIDFP